MTKESNMITKSEDGQVTGIRVAGINFSTKEAFIEYRENHQFKTGDSVQALVKEYSETKIHPALICGINDFGGNRVSIDIAYMDGYDNLKFDSVFSDEISGGTQKTSGVIGLAPVNEFNNHGLRCANVLAALASQIMAKEVELEKLRNHRGMLTKFMESMKG